MTLHFHGLPITPASVLAELGGRCFCVRYGEHYQVETAHRIGQSVMLDNGAYSFWRKGTPTDWPSYYEWADRWLDYRTTWAVIPDVIDGDDEDNDRLLKQWPFGARGAPVWHLHESLERLQRLCDEWPRVCLGSSGDYAVVGSPAWRHRMAEAMEAVCLDQLPLTDLHMLRGMGQVGGPYPFASVDSTDIARNHNRPHNTARKLADRWDAIQCPARWTGAVQQPLGAAA